VLAIAEALVAGPALPQAPAQSEADRREAEEAPLHKEEQQKAEIAFTSPAGAPWHWVSNLKNMGAGGWTFFAGYDDGKTALLVTRHDAQRNGNIAVWMRTEYRDPQIGPLGNTYQSVVERWQLDCVSRTLRSIAVVDYSGADLAGKAISGTTPNAAWEPIVPGSGGEGWIDWACKVTRPKKSAAPQ
jgi:hypothetical protein